MTASAHPRPLQPRLLRDTSGQATVLLALASGAIALFLLFEINSLGAVTRRIDAQNATDTAAIAGADWVARGLNAQAMGNIAMAMTLADIMMVEAVHHATDQGWMVIACSAALTKIAGVPGWDYVGEAWEDYTEFVDELMDDDMTSLDGGGAEQAAPVDGSRFKRLRDDLWWSFESITRFQDAAWGAIPSASLAWTDIVGRGNGLSAAVVTPAEGPELVRGEVTDLCETVKHGNFGGYAWNYDVLERAGSVLTLFVDELIAQLDQALDLPFDLGALLRGHITFESLIDDLVEYLGTHLMDQLVALPGPIGDAFRSALTKILFGAGGEAKDMAQDARLTELLMELQEVPDRALDLSEESMVVQTGPLQSIEQMMPFLWVTGVDHIRWLAPLLWYMALLDVYDGYCDPEADGSPFQYLAALTMFLCCWAVGSFVPGIGDLIGALVGAILGAVVLFAKLSIKKMIETLVDTVLYTFTFLIGGLLNEIAGLFGFGLEDVILGWVDKLFKLMDEVVPDVDPTADVRDRWKEWKDHWLEDDNFDTARLRTEEGMRMATPVRLASAEDLRPVRLAIGLRPPGVTSGVLAPNLFHASSPEGDESASLTSGRSMLAVAEVYNDAVDPAPPSAPADGDEPLVDPRIVESLLVPRWGARLRPSAPLLADGDSRPAFSVDGHSEIYDGLDPEHLDEIGAFVDALEEMPADALDRLCVH